MDFEKLHQKIGDYTFDSVKGGGAVPWHQSIDYMGFVIYMYPKDWLRLADPLPDGKPIKPRRNNDASVDNIIAPPFFEVRHDDEHNVWIIKGHEGRHRMYAVNQANPDIKVPVYFFTDVKVPNITEEMLWEPFIPQPAYRNKPSTSDYEEKLEYIEKRIKDQKNFIENELDSTDPQELIEKEKKELADLEWRKEQLVWYHEIEMKRYYSKAEQIPGTRYMNGKEYTQPINESFWNLSEFFLNEETYKPLKKIVMTYDDMLAEYNNKTLYEKFGEGAFPLTIHYVVGADGKVDTDDDLIVIMDKDDNILEKIKYDHPQFEMYLRNMYKFFNVDG